jgi:hypothetical protein
VLGLVLERDCCDSVDHVLLVCMILTNSHEQVSNNNNNNNKTNILISKYRTTTTTTFTLCSPFLVNHGISVSHLVWSGEFLRSRTRTFNAVQRIISKVAVIGDTVVDQRSTTAVLMDPCASLSRRKLLKEKKKKREIFLTLWISGVHDTTADAKSL